MKKLSVTKKIMLGSIVALFLLGLVGYEGLTEENTPNEIMVIQMPFTGTLDFHFSAGTKLQLFGTVTRYPKSFQFWFDTGHESGMGAIATRFADASSADIFGGVRITYPRNDKDMRTIHETYGSAAAIEGELVNSVIQKSFYNIGPLMTAQESYKDRRPDIIRLATDMANAGVYKVVTVPTTVIDAITGEEKSGQKMEIVEEAGAPGGYARQEESKLAEVHLVASNMAISKIAYEDKVLDQIAEQQKAQMAVQTAIAKAKEAEQNAITAEQQGIEAATRAEWEQNVIKAKAIALATQKKEVAKLAKEEAGFIKAQQILLGEGEAARKKLVMEADGALEIKVKAWKEVNFKYAEAIANYKGNWVPTTVMGGTGQSADGTAGVNGASALIQMLTVKTAKDLALDTTITGTKNKK